MTTPTSPPEPHPVALPGREADGAVAEALVRADALTEAQVAACRTAQRALGGAESVALAQVVARSGLVESGRLREVLADASVRGVVIPDTPEPELGAGMRPILLPIGNTPVPDVIPATPPPGGTGSGEVSSEVAAEVADARADPRRERIAGYLILDTIARGDRGVVHRAWDERNEREVVVKSLPRSELAADGALDRVVREARAASRLHHPAIVAATEVGEENGRPYLVTELVPGRSLAASLERSGPLEARAAVTLVRELALAVDHAHRSGVVHRDIKPSNVLIRDEDGRPFLTDFGLARTCTDPTGITETGAFLGTPGYAAPEQIEGDRRRMGPTSDVFSLGAVLFFALTGHPPFAGDGPVAIIVASVRGEPTALRVHRPDADPRLEAIVRRCVSRDPADRYPSAAALGADLRRWLAGEPLVAGTGGGRRGSESPLRSAPLLGGLLLVAATVVLAAVLALGPGGATAPPTPAAIRATRTAAAEARAAFNAARDALAGSPDDDDLVAAALGAGRAALAATGALVEAAPGDESARLDAFATAMAVGETARGHGRAPLARRAFEAAVALGVDDARARAALAALDRDD